MVSKVTLEEVREELAIFPLVMMMPRDPRINPELTTITIEHLDMAKQKLPKLMGFLEQARQSANAYSSLDAQINQVDRVKISNEHTQPIATLMREEDGKHVMLIRTDLLLGMPHDMALVMLTHEYKHMHDHANGKLHSMTEQQRKVIEYTADRAAGKPLAIAIALLGLMTSEEFVQQYYQIRTNQKYPPLRDRIMAALESAYGNKDFRDSGWNESDGHFYPIRQDLSPVLEDGKKVLNWDAELAPNIRKLVDADISYIDRIVGIKIDPIQSSDIKDFLNYLIPRIKNFQQAHQFYLQAPDNAYLAKQFETALEVPVRREGVMNMHEKMPLAFEAYDEAVKQASQFVTPFAQDAVINNARQHIVDGISEGKYPEIEKSQILPEIISIPAGNGAELAQ